MGWEIPRDFKNETVLQWMKDVSESATISRKISSAIASAIGIEQDGILTPNT